MSKILFLKGLPASGKSTFAKDLVSKEPDTWVRVNKDSLRTMLHDGKWSKGREKTVQAMQRAMAEAALAEGQSVIVDDTNLAPKHEATYRQMAEKHGAQFEIMSFDTSIEECIERDRKRSDSVGKDVIMRMFYQFMCEKKEDSEKEKAIIFDVDGTLAVMKDRSPFDWDKVGQDELNIPVAKALHAFGVLGFQILIVTGRDGICEEQTKAWLLSHGLAHNGFWIRPEGNTEKDTIIKQRIYDDHIKNNYDVVAVFDDRPCVVRMWRKNGLFVFDCGNGIEF